MNKLQGVYWTCLAAPFLAGGLAVAADASAPVQLRYAMAPGKTNAYTLTVTMQGEAGREVMTGTILVSARKDDGNLVLTFRGQVRPKPIPGAPMMMGYRPGAPPSLASYFGYTYGPLVDAREMTLNEAGRLLRSSNDPALPVPLGTFLTSFLPGLPAEVAAGWEKDEAVCVLDEPLLAGPSQAFLPTGGPMPYLPNRPVQGILSAHRKTKVTAASASADFIALETETSLATDIRTGNEPRVSGTTKTKTVLDRAEGWPRTVDVEATSAALTENLSRRSLLTLQWQLLEGAEREAALKPVPPRPREIPASDLPNLVQDLQSDDSSKRINAARELTIGDRTLKPTPELLALAVKLTSDREDIIRQAAYSLLGNYGTHEHAPVLLRGLKEAGNCSSRMAAAKGLGRLQEPKAAEPLAELIAAGQTDQSSFYRRDTPVMEALIKIGPAAEPAVLALLKEKHGDTRIQACNILKQIGTKKSLPALKELTGNPVKEISEAAAEAARYIQARTTQ